MPDEAAEKDVIAALFEEFPQLERELRESGLSLDDKDVRETVLITAKVFTDHLTERTNRIRSTIALELDRMVEGIKDSQSRVAFFPQIVVFIAGLVAAAWALAGNFESFRAAFKTIVTILKHSIASLPFGVAYAATPLGTNEATASILPVIIYGIYMLLAIGYVGSFFAMIFAPDKKVRSDAFEYLKQITALFIGVASGKLI